MTPVLLLSYEFPPEGRGIGEHVRRLALAVSDLDPDLSVHVIANRHRSLSGYSKEDGINLHAISSWIDGNNFLNWGMVLNSEFVREATSLHHTSGITILHAHDWMTVPAAVTMKIAHQIPFVLTIHSTEKKRCNGLHSEYSMAIDSIEDKGIREASFVIVNDEETRNELLHDFGAAKEKVESILPYSKNWAVRTASIYNRVSFGVSAR